MVKYLINWTQEGDCKGGSETRYNLLQRAFPNAKLISAVSLTDDTRKVEIRKAVDNFIDSHTTENDIVIKDAGVGGTRKVKAKTILFFGNPYLSLMRLFDTHIGVLNWQNLVELQKEDYKYSTFCIANSNFSKYDAELSGCKIDVVLNNGVDTDFWQPVEKEKKYILWVGSEFKNTFSGYDFSVIKQPFVKIYKEAKFSREDMLDFYQGAICLLHSFPIEGNSNAVLEALSCNIPILTQQCGLFWDRDVDVVGRFLPTKNENLVRSINRLIMDKDALTPRKFIFDNQLTANHYIEKIREIVACHL